MIMVINGKWEWTPAFHAVGFGILFQFIITFWEWLTRNNKFSIWYLIPLTIDVGSTIYSYADILFAPLYRQFYPVMGAFIIPFTTINVAHGFVWIIISLSGFLLAYLPEAVLIDE